jgi:hypothetical protein
MEEKEKTIPISEHKRLKKIFAEEISRKDETIEKLRQENKIILETALKESIHRAKLNEEIEKLRKSLERKKEQNPDETE